jgi:uncharacterized membrane protein YgdD (TMEM256/DUF423 family)
MGHWHFLKTSGPLCLRLLAGSELEDIAFFSALRYNPRMHSVFFLTGSLLGGLGVALGAFGAHGLKNRLRPERLETFETAVRYQLYHALALLATGFTADSGGIFAALAGWLFLAGILLFSGSLYLLVLTNRRWLGAITPLGGVAFVAGWLCLALAAFYK